VLVLVVVLEAGDTNIGAASTEFGALGQSRTGALPLELLGLLRDPWQPVLAHSRAPQDEADDAAGKRVPGTRRESGAKCRDTTLSPRSWLQAATKTVRKFSKGSKRAVRKLWRRKELERALESLGRGSKEPRMGPTRHCPRPPMGKFCPNQAHWWPIRPSGGHRISNGRGRALSNPVTEFSHCRRLSHADVALTSSISTLPPGLVPPAQRPPGTPCRPMPHPRLQLQAAGPRCAAGESRAARSGPFPSHGPGFRRGLCCRWVPSVPCLHEGSHPGGGGGLQGRHHGRSCLEASAAEVVGRGRACRGCLTKGLGAPLPCAGPA